MPAPSRCCIDAPLGRCALATVPPRGNSCGATRVLCRLTYNYGVESYDMGDGFGHFGLAVNDVYATAAAVKAAGGRVTREPGPVKGGKTNIAFVGDPAGYSWELIEREGQVTEPIAQVGRWVGAWVGEQRRRAALPGEGLTVGAQRRCRRSQRRGATNGEISSCPSPPIRASHAIGDAAGQRPGPLHPVLHGGAGHEAAAHAVRGRVCAVCSA